MNELIATPTMAGFRKGIVGFVLGIAVLGLAACDDADQAGAPPPPQDEDTMPPPAAPPQ